MGHLQLRLYQSAVARDSGDAVKTGKDLCFRHVVGITHIKELMGARSLAWIFSRDIVGGHAVALGIGAKGHGGVYGHGEGALCCVEPCAVGSHGQNISGGGLR